MWLGSERMLNQLGAQPDSPVSMERLALALQGCHTITGERVRREGMIHRLQYDRRGRPLLDADGRRVRARVLGTKSVDLTFSAPKSVSVVWSQARPELRTEIELAVTTAATAMLEYMTQTKPVVAQYRKLSPARSFAGAAALHVQARTASGESAPAPQLHVHGVVVGVERADGFFASPELSGLFKHGAPLEGGAVARVRLAESLIEMGFAIEPDAGPGRRFFEIRDVPAGLVEALSGRSRDVRAKVDERETARGKRLTNLERSVAALQTRAPKSADGSPTETMAAWRDRAERFNFTHVAVDGLRRGGGFAEDVARRRESVLTAIRQRLRGHDGPVSHGDARALVYESAAGRLRLAEAADLVSELERSGGLSPRDA